jgi:DNA replication protein DnaC
MKYGIIHSSSLFEILRLNTLRGIDEGAEEYDNLFRKIMFLTIDDCGAEKMTPFKEEKLDSIINDRYENNKNKETINQNVLSPINPITTILNTNLSAKDFNIAYPRIFSRFREGHIFTINSKDERK